MEEREALRNAVPKLALDAPVPGGGVLADLAPEVLKIARAGLAARGQLNSVGDNETGFLAPLDEIAKRRKVPAQDLLDRYHGEWNGSVAPIYKYSL